MVFIPEIGIDIDESPAMRIAVARWLALNAKGSENLPVIVSPQLALFCAYWLQRGVLTDA